MNDLGRWLADRLGVEAAEFDRWQFLWGRAPTATLVLLATVGVLAFLFLSWRAGKTVDNRRRRALLISLRAAAGLAAAVLIFDPSLEFLKTKKRDQRFAVLVDASRSMTLKDESGRRRLEHVRGHFSERSADFDSLEARFKVGYYSFDEAVKPFDRKAIDALEAAGNETLIGESLDDLLRSLGADAPAGVLLFSDGADRGRVRAALDARGLLAPVPVFPVLLPESTPPDAAVLDVRSDPYAFVRNGFDVRARIDVRGIKADAFTATLRIDGQVAATQTVDFTGKQGPVEVMFRTVPQRVGRYVYSVEIPLFAGEAIKDNNRRGTIVKVVRDRVRVLQVVGEPSWDERFLRRYLEKDPNIDLISFMILRTREDLDATPEHELSLIPFPTRELFTEELQGFDLVIFQNFDYRPYFELFPGQLLNNIRNFIEIDGGGFVMIGGDKSFTDGGYLGSPLAAVLPIELAPGGGHDAGQLRPELTEEGLRHPITSLDLSPGEAKDVWRSLPAAAGANNVGGPRPGASVLLRHPQIKTADGGGMPVLSIGDFGKGRVMALTLDSSWMWSFEVAGEGGSGAYYQRFWSNAIRWLVHDPDFGRVRLESDADTYDLNTPIKLRCTVLDERYRPAPADELRLEVRPRGQDGWRSPPVQELETGVHTTEYRPKAGGVYEARCVAKVAGKSAGEETILVNVDDLGRELQDTAVHNEILRALAERSGGRAIRTTASDWREAVGLDDEAPFEVVGRKVVRIWDNVWLLLLLAALLSTEWFLRRRWGGL